MQGGWSIYFRQRNVSNSQSICTARNVCQSEYFADLSPRANFQYNSITFGASESAVYNGHNRYLRNDLIGGARQDVIPLFIPSSFMNRSSYPILERTPSERFTNDLTK